MQQSAIDQTASDANQSNIVTRDELAQIVDDCFQAMLGIPIDTSTPRECDIPEGTVFATIKITGVKNATVQVAAPKSLAAKIACTMFMMEPDELADEELLDAFGEIVNVIGGNVKGVIDNDCTLSLPCVGDDPLSQLKDEVPSTFECEGEPFFVTLVEN